MASTSDISSSTPTNPSAQKERYSYVEQARKREQASVHPKTWSRESWDTYAQLKLLSSDQVKIKLFIYDNDCSHHVQEFCPQRNLEYHVRIPAIMFIYLDPDIYKDASGAVMPIDDVDNRKDAVLNEIMAHFRDKNLCRRQIGAKLFVVKKADYNSEPMEMLQTFWTCLDTTIKPEPMRRYLTTQPSPINAVYPCYRHDPNTNELELVLGLVFTQDLGAQARRRSFSRFHFTKAADINKTMDNRWAFDLTERFIVKETKEEKEKKVKEDPLWVNYESEFLKDKSKNNNDTIAFYVCRGAKLLVRDSRYAIDETGKQQESAGRTEASLDHTRSLFQQGSLLVINGTVRAYAQVVQKRPSQN